MDINKDFIPSGRNNRPGFSMSPDYITIHDTGNSSVSADAQMHAKYLKSETAATIPVSWHFTVDDTMVIQHLPLDESGWHAGDDRDGEGNRNSIGVEICENQNGDRKAAEHLAAELVVYLLDSVDSLKQFPACMKHHWDWTQKDCPAVLRRGEVHTWKEWLELIDDLRAAGGSEVPNEEEPPEWKTEPIDYFADRDLLYDPKDWKNRIDEPMPVWAAFIILMRIHRDLKHQ